MGLLLILYILKDCKCTNFPRNSGKKSFSIVIYTFGQIFSYVLSGEVRFDLDGKSFVLKPGDNIYFNAKSQFNAINYFDGVSEIIWVQSPPSY